MYDDSNSIMVTCLDALLRIESILDDTQEKIDFYFWISWVFFEKHDLKVIMNDNGKMEKIGK